MIEQTQVIESKNKTRNLVLGIIFDGIGLLSFTIPVLGEFSDVVWAPLAAYLMTTMYKGKVGKIGGAITFLEELLPFTDFIPSFTLTWVYNYLIKSSKI